MESKLTASHCWPCTFPVYIIIRILVYFVSSSFLLFIIFYLFHFCSLYYLGLSLLLAENSLGKASVDIDNVIRWHNVAYFSSENVNCHLVTIIDVLRNSDSSWKSSMWLGCVDWHSQLVASSGILTLTLSANPRLSLFYYSLFFAYLFWTPSIRSCLNKFKFFRARGMCIKVLTCTS